MKATERTRRIYQTLSEKAPGTRGPAVRGKRFDTGKTMTIRTGTCPTHGRESSEFVGANEHGWIFACKGEDGPHYFVNEPPGLADA